VVRLPAPLRPLFPYIKPAYVRATALLAPAMQQISARRGSWLPTGVAETLEQAAASSGGRCIIAREAEILSRPAMLGIPEGLRLADTGDGESVPRVAVVELPGGRVLGPHRAVITGQGDLVHEVSRYFGTHRPHEHPLFLNPSPPPPLRAPGRVGVLACRGDSNYYHFLMDGLTRLGVMEQAPGMAAPERWYVSQRLPFQRELLDLFGVAPEQRIDADAYPHLCADTLVVPGPPAMVEKNPPWAVRFLRERLLPAAGHSRPPTPIYVTRGPSANNRSVTNETAVQDLLRAHGFVDVDPGAMSVLDQVRAFADAPVVVAPHGAALTNLMFMSPGSTVIELFPAGCVLPDYWRMACGVPELRYRYLAAGGRPRRPTRARTIVRDITVDLDALCRILADLSW
jgi:capsular polysaccharide biosynthesis protein